MSGLSAVAVVFFLCGFGSADANFLCIHYDDSATTVDVNGETLEANNIILATGSEPIALPFLPVDEKRCRCPCVQRVDT